MPVCRRTCLFWRRGKSLRRREGREELIEAIGQIYDQMPQVDGISISIPGIIDPEKGYCAMGGALQYNNDFYMRERLYQRCPVKICMENDANCAAMAEAAVGSLKDVEDGFVLNYRNHDRRRADPQSSAASRKTFFRGRSFLYKYHAG